MMKNVKVFPRLWEEYSFGKASKLFRGKENRTFSMRSKLQRVSQFVPNPPPTFPGNDQREVPLESPILVIYSVYKLYKNSYFV